MKKLLFSTWGVSVLFLCSAFTMNNTTAPAKKIAWIAIEDVFEKVEEEPKNIVIDVYTNWCGWCKKMDKTTFGHPKVAQYVNEKYHAVKLNAEMKKPITVGDKTYKYVKQGRRGSHELAAALLQNRMSFPSTVILGDDLATLTIVPGFVDAPMMDKVLRYFGDGFHGKVHWKEFDQTFKSKIK